MAHQHKLQSQRFELKFLVDENKAVAMRRFLANHLEPDEYTDPETGLGYSVRSLYMDTPSLVLRQQTVEGLKNRFKLRIRFYDDNPESPAFLEIKRRENDVIRKERAGVTRAGVQKLLAGGRPELSDLIKNDVDSVSAMNNFCTLCETIGARGSLFVVYFREAYVSPNSDELRVTFDRQIVSQEYEQGRVLWLPPQAIKTDIKEVVAELKFSNRFPRWMREMVQAFNMSRTSVPKYVECVDATRRVAGTWFAFEHGVAP